MAEVLGIAASVIAVIQIADRITELCKFYIESISEVPSSLRAILIEVSTLKTVFETLEFLESYDHTTPPFRKQLSASDGPIEGCKQAIAKLEKIFPSGSVRMYDQGARISKRQKAQAAFATLAWPLKENRVKDLLRQISNFKSIIHLTLTTESIQDIKAIKANSEEIRTMLTSTQRHEVYKWLETTDPSPLHNRARKLYEAGTGNWMLRSEEWTNWLTATHRCLWIHGIPGAGKTILASWLIEKVKEHCHQQPKGKIAHIYYYCYFGRNQDEAMPFLRWIISKLSRQAEVVSHQAYELYKRGGEPSLVELLESLEMALQNFDNAYVVIDAVDESSPRSDILKIIRDLATDSRFSKVQVLVTSREYVDIERAMESISVFVSMSNPLVKEDIRSHVRSALRSNLKFRRWPSDLLTEVEDAVSTEAKGMFRWAVCQLDELQRLKCERSIIKNALATLPKTLDETYRRIFLRIYTEERLFVCHAFYWICFYQAIIDRYGSGVPCPLLLESIRQSMVRVSPYEENVFYDSETLRELCGCLLSIAPGYRPGQVVVSFAHYTVKEYLDSTRILNDSISFFTTNMPTILPTCLEVVFFEAQRANPDNLWVLVEGTSSDQDIWDFFPAHCILCTICSLRTWPQEISMNDKLFGLAKAVLDPSTRLFDSLNEIYNPYDAIITDIFEANNETFSEAESWTIAWKGSAPNLEVALLLSLLLVGKDEISALAERLLRGSDLKVLLNTSVVFEKCISENYESDSDGWGSKNYATYEFSGSVIELMGQFADHHFNNFWFLLNHYTGLYDPSKALLHFIGYHESRFGQHRPCDGNEFKCPVQKLLNVGADPNLPGYCVTPLQIAVVSWDAEGVRMLLESGANPNCTGDSDGISWGDKNALARFNHLHGVCPLVICRNLDCLFGKHDYKRVKRRPSVKTIESLLLQYGATK